VEDERMTATALKIACIVGMGTLALTACGGNSGEASSDESAVAQLNKASPTVTVSPNPVQAGSIAVTKPTLVGTGFASGHNYSIQVNGGYNQTALQTMACAVTADKTGSFSCAIANEIPNMPFVGPSSTVDVWSYDHRGIGTIVATTTLQITPDPGTAAVTPSAGVPGTTFSLAGSGASPGASLTGQWYDATGCTGWGFDPGLGCTWTLKSVTLTADASGAFSASFTPSAQNNGFCEQWVTIQDQASGAIVANPSFSFCPM
jgi:hypothetical protein